MRNLTEKIILKHKEGVVSEFTFKEGEGANNGLIFHFVKNIHSNPDDFEIDYLGEKIKSMDFYTLKEIKISDISCIDRNDIDKKAEPIMKMDLNTMPPIIVDSELVIIDGTARVNALLNMGVDTVTAFVGNYSLEDVYDEYEEYEEYEDEDEEDDDEDYIEVDDIEIDTELENIIKDNLDCELVFIFNDKRYVFDCGYGTFDNIYHMIVVPYNKDFKISYGEDLKRRIDSQKENSIEEGYEITSFRFFVCDEGYSINDIDEYESLKANISSSSLEDGNIVIKLEEI